MGERKGKKTMSLKKSWKCDQLILVEVTLRPGDDGELKKGEGNPWEHLGKN